MRAGARRARRAVVALGRDGHVHRDDAVQRARRTWSLAAMQGIAAQVAELAASIARRPRLAAVAGCASTADWPAAAPSCRPPPTSRRSRSTSTRSTTRPALGAAATGLLALRPDLDVAVGDPARGRPATATNRRGPPTAPPSSATAGARPAGAMLDARPRDAPRSAMTYDVAVIGAGVVGTAIARELSGYDARRRARRGAQRRRRRHQQGQHRDPAHRLRRQTRHARVAAGPARLRTAVGSTRPRPGSPSSAPGHCSSPGPRTSSNALPALRDKAVGNGYEHCAARRQRARCTGGCRAWATGALGGLTVPDESVICTWTTSLAFATEAKQRGARPAARQSRHAACRPAPPRRRCTATAATCRARWVVNAAGLGCRPDRLDVRLRPVHRHAAPRRTAGLRQAARPLVDTIVLPVPSALGKGVLVSPTIYGNVLLGPTAEDIDDRTDTATSEDGPGVPARQGRGDHAGAAGRGGHRQLRRTAGRHR